MPSRAIAATIGGALSAALVLAAAPPATAAVETPALPIVRPAADIRLPAALPSEQLLPEVADNPADASINRGVMPYDEIAPFVNDLIESSDRVSAQVVGKSAQGRDIYLVTVTKPETAAEVAQQAKWRDAIKYSPAAAAADDELAEGYKVPIWYNGNIHGNEWEGTDITLNYIEELATSADPEVEALLSGHRLYFTVTNNPDGRALGQRATATGYDANRDFITGATAEAAIVRDLAGVIQPTYFIDLHGYTGVLQVEPCGPPHGENYEYDLFVPHAYSTALAIEEAVVAANIPGNTYYDRTKTGNARYTTTNTGQINIPYRDQRSGWDDWPPIFAPQYVAYQGAITNTVELPLGRVTSTTQNKANAAVNIAVGEIVVETVADYVAEHHDTLLANQIEIFSRGIAGEPIAPIPADVSAEDLPAGTPTEWTEIWDETDVFPTEIPRAYVIPMGEGQRSDSDAERLVEQLLVHDIQVQRTTAPLKVGGTTYAKGSFVVDMHQPLRGLANVLLADGSDISKRTPAMYDISAWSLSLLWGADVVPVGDTTDPALKLKAQPITTVAQNGSAKGGRYQALRPTGVSEYQAVIELLAEGVALSQLADGTIVVGPGKNDAVQRAADTFGVVFESHNGAGLRDATTVALSLPTVGYVGSEYRDVLAKLGYRDTVELTATGIASSGVPAQVDVILGNVSFDPRTYTPAQIAAGNSGLAEFVARGGDLVGSGSAGATMATSSGIAAVVATTAPGGSNGIVNVTTPASGVLGDYAQDTAFVYPATWYSGTGLTVEQSYDATDPFVSGHWADQTGRSQMDAAGKPAAISAVKGTSKLFLFGTTPSFRTHPVGAFSDIARALLWTADAGTPVTPPNGKGL
ncbi:M14 family zinc carboxypeptidase [Herbiconiux sp. SYSU D00978]|uniref:M14 family zinc carboxypeptidase n=1 Tax=Herbiconiux sp. SYSU D00978 TaxID=2812562 RepID=UPI001A9761D5|nr:M14 family zinc carboxypeptidase [Herbiconiux sp. SYSU D00978]